MKTALILGINGGFGSHVAQALANQGWHIRALMRNSARLSETRRTAEVIVGDAGNIEDVRRAAQGADLIVYGVNPANYGWQGVVLPLLENTARIAEENGQTIVFPGNVYVFNPNDGPQFDESSPMQPVSTLGEMRKSMEARLKLASERGARIIILRMGDFIGKGAKSTWLCQLIKVGKQRYRLATTGPEDLAHSWAYLPDVANTIVELVAKREQLEPFSVFHFKGYQASFIDIANAIQQATGKKVKFKAFPWLLISLLAPFSALFRGLTEMRYLWQREVNLNNNKMHAILDKTMPSTPLAEALIESGLLTQK